MDAVPGIIAGTHGPGAMSSRRLPLWAGWLLALAVAAACASLGAWQLQRMHAKQAQVDAAAQVLADRRADPLSAAADPASARGYRWSAGEGAFLPLPAVLLDNQNRGGRAGVHAYRVFQPRAEHATPLLVDLGWLPLPGDRRLPDVPRPPATRVAGLLAPPPSPGLIAPVLEVQADGTLLAVVLEPAAVADALGLPALAPRVLRLDPDLPMGYARDLEVLANTLQPERHLGYAVQWFALSAAVLVIALLLTLRARRRR